MELSRGEERREERGGVCRDAALCSLIGWESVRLAELNLISNLRHQLQLAAKPRWRVACVCGFVRACLCDCVLFVSSVEQEAS